MTDLNVRIFKAVSLDVYNQMIRERAAFHNNNNKDVSDLYGLKQYGEGRRESNNNTNTVDSSSSSEESVSSILHDTSDVMSILPLFSVKEQTKAKKLMEILKSKGLSWNPIGEVELNGKLIPRTNVVDLISTAVHPAKLRKLMITGLTEFAAFVKQHNVPMQLLGNAFITLSNQAVLKKPTTLSKVVPHWTVYERSALAKH